ncbi:exodeoxyribonuclease III [Oerskovia sp. M15]
MNGIRAAYRRGWTPGSPRAPRTSCSSRRCALLTRSSTPSWARAGTSPTRPATSRGVQGSRSRRDSPCPRCGSGWAGRAEPPVDTGRWVEADVELASGETLTVVSTYIHSGTAGTPTMDEKYAYLEKVTERLRELSVAGGLAVVAGDLNIAHRNVDIKNWKGNQKSAGFLPEERAYLDTWFDELGWWTSGAATAARARALHLVVVARAGVRQRLGLAHRLPARDPALAERAVKAEVDRADDYESRWSDHAALVATYDL